MSSHGLPATLNFNNIKANEHKVTDKSAVPVHDTVADIFIIEVCEIGRSNKPMI